MLILLLNRTPLALTDPLCLVDKMDVSRASERSERLKKGDMLIESLMDVFDVLCA